MERDQTPTAVPYARCRESKIVSPQGPKCSFESQSQQPWFLLGKFAAWLAKTGRQWYEPDLAGRTALRAIEYIVGSYPVMVNGEMATVKPHDLRRTYARRLYDAGFDLVAIQQNLGHADVKTTLGYIGTLDAEQRKPPAVLSFDLRQPNGVHAHEQIEDV